MNETPLILDRLVVIRLDGTLWGGRKRLRREDLILGDGSLLPPESLASLGSKRIADPRDLLVFSRLKREAERICLQVGSRFLGGIAIPECDVGWVRLELERIRSEFEAAKAGYLARYDERIDDWVGQHPDFAQAIRRAVEPVDVVRHQLQFDYVVFRLKSSRDSADGLDRRVDGLSAQLLDEVAVMARELASASLNGKDRVTRKALSPLKKIRRKLDALSFLDTGIQALADRLGDVIQRTPRSGEISGPFLKEICDITDRLSLKGAALQTHESGATTSASRLFMNAASAERPLPDGNLLAGLEPSQDGTITGMDQELSFSIDSIVKADENRIESRSYWF